MGIMDKFKKPAGDGNYEDMYNNDYYDGFDDGYDEQNDGGQNQAGGMNDNGYNTSYNTAYNNGYNSNMNNTSYGSQAGSFSNSASNGGISLSGNAIEVRVVKPVSFDCVTQIADHLVKKRTIILNLEKANKETARRLVDFLSGVAYSIEGSLTQVASNAYIITPANVDVGDAQLRSRQNAENRNSQQTQRDESRSGGFGEL